MSFKVENPTKCKLNKSQKQIKVSLNFLKQHYDKQPVVLLYCLLLMVPHLFTFSLILEVRFSLIS